MNFAVGVKLQLKKKVNNETITKSTCFFPLDTEPPICGYCPTDILLDNITGKSEVRINWNRPICTDNSGKLPSISSTRMSGDYFSPIPGVFAVQYTVSDNASNVNKNCSFTITLKRKY